MNKVYVLMRDHRMESTLLGVFASLKLAKACAAQDGHGNYHGDAAWRSYYNGHFENGDYRVVPRDVAEEVPY